MVIVIRRLNMNKRELQKEETIIDILKHSEELFHEKGYEKTTIQNIADKCGLSKGAMYHHFKSKEEVLERICLNHYRFLVETFMPIAEDSDLTMPEKIRKIMNIARTSQMNTAAAAFSKGAENQVSSADNAVMEVIFESYSVKFYIEVFSPILEEGREKGECRFPGSADVIAVFIHQLDTGVSRQLNIVLSDADSAGADKAVKDLIDGFTFALSKLLDIDYEIIADITLAEMMQDQYLKILHERKKDTES